MAAPGEQVDIDYCKNLTKSWLLQGVRFDRKKDHREFNPRDHPMMPVEVMDLQVWVLRPPPVYLLSDRELDEFAGLIEEDARAAAAEDPAVEAAAAELAEPADAGPEAGGGSAHSSSSSGKSSSSSRKADSAVASDASEVGPDCLPDSDSSSSSSDEEMGGVR